MSDQTLASLRLPIILDIEGAAETGTELRLSCPEPGILESLCIAWFRFGDAAATPSFDTDISVSPLTRVIPGATSSLYTPGPEDVGRRLGATVRAAGNSSTRWIIMPTAVRQLASSVEVRVRVMPHVHTKYCDRRVRVCTAAGRYREGATLRAEITGLAPELASQYGIVWYRSTTTDPRLARRRPTRLSMQNGRSNAEPSASASARGSATTSLRAPPMSPIASPLPGTARDIDSPRPTGIMSQAWNLLSGSSRRNMVRSQSMSEATPAIASSSASAVLALHHGSTSNSGSSITALAGLTYVRVRQRCSDELPPAPPDHISSTPLPELKALLANLASRMSQSGTLLPPPLPLPPADAPLGQLEYALFADDVDRLICCALVRLDAPGDISTYIQPHGPACKPRSATAPMLSDTLPSDASFQETQRTWFAYPEASASAKLPPLAMARVSNESLLKAGVSARTPPLSPHKSFRDMQREWFAYPPDKTKVLGADTTEIPTLVAAAVSGVSVGTPANVGSSATVPAAPAPQVFVDERWGDTPEKVSFSEALPVAVSSSDESEAASLPVLDLTQLVSLDGLDSKPSPAPPASPSLPPISKPVSAEPLVGALRSDIRLSVSIGPIEAAPPRAREVWIDGVPAVGCLLTGHVYYYGGYEGSSEACWVAITEVGDTVELKPPTLCDPSISLPDFDAPVGSAADDHPRALRLTSNLLGHLIKFKIKPARRDGDVGHMESSRPTPEIAASSESSVIESGVLAAAQRAARIGTAT